MGCGMKVSVIGASGRVGKAAAFSLAEESVVSEVVLLAREKKSGPDPGRSPGYERCHGCQGYPCGHNSQL